METHFLFVWSVCAATLKIYWYTITGPIWIVNLQSHHGRALNKQKVILPFLNGREKPSNRLALPLNLAYTIEYRPYVLNNPKLQIQHISLSLSLSHQTARITQSTVSIWHVQVHHPLLSAFVLSKILLCCLSSAFFFWPYTQTVPHTQLMPALFSVIKEEL